jgi:sulfite reductase (ferredoxin)
MVDAYYFCVGGSVGQFASIARPVGYRCAATDVPGAIERLLLQFNENRAPGENLRQFFARHSNEDLRSILAGGFTTPVERDAAARTAIPLGVET